MEQILVWLKRWHSHRRNLPDHPMRNFPFAANEKNFHHPVNFYATMIRSPTDRYVVHHESNNQRMKCGNLFDLKVPIFLRVIKEKN